MKAITESLQAWRGGDAAAFDALVPQVYPELRRIAARLMREQSPAHTLQPTALAVVELVFDDLKLFIGEVSHVAAFGQVLAQQSVGVLVGAALPRTVGVLREAALL